MVKKIILTGATGLFGSNVIKKFKNKDKIIFWGNNKKSEFSDYKIQYLDLTKFSIVEKQITKIKPKTIIHAAALTDVDKCEKKINEAYLLNVKVTNNIAKICKKHKIKMIYLSTDQIFDGKKKIYNEKDIVNPINIYGLTKSLSEKNIISQLKNYLIIRTNFFGWGTKSRKSLSDFIIENLKKKKNIYMYKDIYFNPLNVENLIYYIIKLNALKFRGIFNLGSDQRISKYNFALKIASQFKFEKKLIKPINFIKKRNKAKRPLNMFLSNNKLKKSLKITNINIYDEILKLKRSNEKSR